MMMMITNIKIDLDLFCIGDSIGTINKIQTIVTIQQRAL